MEDLHNYYLDKEEPIKSCLLGLQSIILRYDENITEAFKWGIPTFLYNGKIFCFISVEKKSQQPYILFEGGKHLYHSALDQKNRKWMKSLDVDPKRDFDLKTIHEVLEEALELHRNGVLYINK